MRIVLAPDTFKGTVSAAEVAAALGAGIRRLRPDALIAGLPIADGGDGTVAAALAAGFDAVPCTVSGPTGEPVVTTYARRGRQAVIELADACGLTRLPGGVPQPMSASSRGLGELIAAALDAGCRRLVIGLGGSASTDGGSGMLAALGVRITDSAGKQIGDGGDALGAAAGLDTSGLHPLLAAGAADLTVAGDVDNPLTGSNGAATVYGPQKGADAAQVAALDRSLRRFADVVAQVTGADLRDAQGAGAAGGVGFAALAVLRATIRPGAQVIFDLAGLPAAVAAADLVITGEGSLDRQTLRGKAPAAVAGIARAAGIPVVAVCGRCELSAVELAAAGFLRCYPLVDAVDHAEQAMTDPVPLLVGIGERIAAELDVILGR